MQTHPNYGSPNHYTSINNNNSDNDLIMSTLSSAVRLSLLSNLKSGASHLRRWSIRDLAETTEVSFANARTLLHEVQLRLALQHGKLENLSDSLSEALDSNSIGRSNPGRPNNGKSRVIRACNFPVAMSIKEYSMRLEASKVEVQKSLKCLKDLIYLHENTYDLAYRLIDGEGKAIFDDFNKPNQRYVSDIFDQIMARHGTSVETFADAIISVRTMQEIMQFQTDFFSEESVESFLRSRLMIQLLCDHYVALNKGKATGAVSIGADIVDVVDDAVTEARHVCDANMGVAPEVVIQPTESLSGDFVPPPIIRSWLHHAIVEVSKNAMTSNIEQWNGQHNMTKDSLLPEVFVKILHENNTLAIRVIDNGTGLNKEKSEKAFRFADSTSQKRWNRLEEQQSYAAVRQPLGSLGVGLPLSRLMMRVFGGDLRLTNNGNSGQGCTATLKVSYDDKFRAEN